MLVSCIRNRIWGILYLVMFRERCHDLYMIRWEVVINNQMWVQREHILYLVSAWNWYKTPCPCCILLPVNSIFYRMQLVHVLCTYESVGMLALMISKLFLSYASLERFLYRRWRAYRSLRHGTKTLYKLFLSTKRALHSSQGVLAPQVVGFFYSTEYTGDSATKPLRSAEVTVLTAWWKKI